MYEVEVKVRAGHDAVRGALDEAGAERVGGVTQIDTYYDAPHRDFAETDEALRIREERPADGERGRADGDAPDGDGSDDADADAATNATTKATYKGPLVDADSKTREEHETRVDDAEAARELFEGIGFEPAAVVEKHRTFFELDGYTVTLDRVDGLGEFVEVEAEAETERDVDAVREGAFEVLRRLGLDPDEQIRTSYLGLLLDGE